MDADRDLALLLMGDEANALLHLHPHLFDWRARSTHGRRHWPLTNGGSSSSRGDLLSAPGSEKLVAGGRPVAAHFHA